MAAVAAFAAWKAHHAANAAVKQAREAAQQKTQLEAQLRQQTKAIAQKNVELKQYEATLAELQAQRDSSSPAPLPVTYRIVLTGGPCGGKTTALAEIKARLEALGFLVFCMPETATLLFGGGVPIPHDESTALVFQRNLLKLQLAAEENFHDLAVSSGRPAVILLDRGTMDGKAYMTDSQWEQMTEELKVTPIMLRDQRYDAILHLVTAADGAEPFYTLATNQVRTETAEQAREMDRKTLDCWTGHEHLYIVDNSTNFEEKMRRAVTRISKLVGVPAPLAVTRKFLLERPPTMAEMKEHVKRFEAFEVDQTYLSTQKANERARIRRRQQGANVSFQHQLWTTEEEGGPETTLKEHTLSAREYFIMLKQADPHRCTVSKTLTCFTWGNTYWELNSFRGAQHVAILEVEAESRESDMISTFPDFLRVVREVTDETSYDSYLIAAQLDKVVAAAEAAETIRPNESKEDLVERQMTEVLHTIELEACRTPGVRTIGQALIASGRLAGTMGESSSISSSPVGSRNGSSPPISPTGRGVASPLPTGAASVSTAGAVYPPAPAVDTQFTSSGDLSEKVAMSGAPPASAVPSVSAGSHKPLAPAPAANRSASEPAKAASNSGGGGGGGGPKKKKKKPV